MNDVKSAHHIRRSVHAWIVTLSILFFSIASTVLALVCIYSLPDNSVKPLQGGIFFLTGAVVLIFFLFFRWKKEIVTNSDSQFVVKENLSDKILKWITALFCFGYVFWGFAIALICIYALPDKSVQPKIGTIYFLGSAIVFASFIFVVWKNWVSNTKQ